MIMTIETKFNIGDEVWFMDDNRPTNAKVCGYEIKYSKGLYFGTYPSGGVKISTYYALIGGNMLSDIEIIEEELLFPTKEELIKSL